MYEWNEKSLKFAEFVACYIGIGVKIDKAVRTPFDAIDANDRGGAYLSGNGNHHWFNKSLLREPRHRALLLDVFPYVSPDARRALLSVDRHIHLPKHVDLMCEHVVPCEVMENMLRMQHDHTPLTAETVLTFHRKLFRRCIVTKAENARLKPTRRMPFGWTADDRVFARYDAAGFEWAQQWA